MQRVSCLLVIPIIYLTSVQIYTEGEYHLGFMENDKQDVAEDGSIIRVKLPNKKEKEQFAQAELMLGSNHIRVRCSDGVTRLGRIKGKIKKRIWIREGDILIVIPWDFQDDKCDIVYRYTTPQVDWLRAHKYL